MAKTKRKSTSRRYKSDDKNLILLALGAVIIVGFFAIFAYKSQNITSIPMPTPTPNSYTVYLGTQNNSGEGGTAILSEANGKVTVTIKMTGYPKGVTQPAHIHVGNCPTPGEVKYSLTSVVNGQSVTTLNNITLANLKALGPIAVNVHKSVSQSSIYYSCGNINF